MSKAPLSPVLLSVMVLLLLGKSVDENFCTALEKDKEEYNSFWMIRNYKVAFKYNEKWTKLIRGYRNE